jgi:hypothetical protein
MWIRLHDFILFISDIVLFTLNLCKFMRIYVLIFIWKDAHCHTLLHTAALPHTAAAHCSTLPHTAAHCCTAAHCMNIHAAHHTPHTAHCKQSHTAIKMNSNDFTWMCMHLHTLCEFIYIYVNLYKIKTTLFKRTWIHMNIKIKEFTRAELIKLCKYSCEFIHMILFHLFQNIRGTPNLNLFMRIYFDFDLKICTQLHCCTLPPCCTLRYTAAHCRVLPHTTAHCRTAAHCRTLLHTTALPHTA